MGFVEFPSALVTVIALFGVMLILLGVMAGLQYGQRVRAVHDKSLDDYYVGKMLRGLYHWTDDFAHDVTRYREIVDSLKRQVRAAEQQSPDSDPAAVVRLLSRIVQANDLLQQRLDNAELTLKEQAAEITSYMSEARTDTLTNLPNRRVFDDDFARRLAEFRRHGTAFSLLIVDIDLFKKFNDRHGHLAGDAVLTHVARLLRAAMRETDLVARLGGEEFAILLPGLDVCDAPRAAERARAAIEVGTFTYEEKSLKVTVSCGGTHAIAGDDAKSFVNRADQALYASKGAGRNCVHWHNGSEMVPISSNATPVTPVALPTPTPADVVTPAGMGRRRDDFSQVCDELRQKLISVVNPQA